MKLSHEDLCVLSRKFNINANLRTIQDAQINAWLKEQIAEAAVFPAGEPEIKMEIQGAPIPMLLFCPCCGVRHIDKGEFAVKHHHTHACQSCGHVWRPAIVPTVGVQFLPGFKDA